MLGVADFSADASYTMIEFGQNLIAGDDNVASGQTEDGRTISVEFSGDRVDHRAGLSFTATRRITAWLSASLSNRFESLFSAFSSQATVDGEQGDKASQEYTRNDIFLTLNARY